MVERMHNALLASERIIVEHAIAGIKRCRIVKEVLRLTKQGVSDQLMEIACGLHNLRIACSQPRPEFDLRALLLAS